jgi:hypothetical protein
MTFISHIKYFDINNLIYMRNFGGDSCNSDLLQRPLIFCAHTAQSIQAFRNIFEALLFSGAIGIHNLNL